MATRDGAEITGGADAQASSAGGRWVFLPGVIVEAGQAEPQPPAPTPAPRPIGSSGGGPGFGLD